MLARHGWESLLVRLGLADLFRLRGRPMDVSPGPVQVRQTLEQLGPTFIKLGQLLSTRSDVIPADYVAELEKLQDSAPPIPIEAVREAIREELGEPIDAIFAQFDDTPLAAASLGQTHLATLKNGREVVVKVQRPGVKSLVETDLEIMAGVARFLEQRFTQARTYGLSDVVDEFSVIIRQELDYTREGRNGDRLRENLADWPQIRIAATIWEHTCTRVLTMERVIGIKITDLSALDAVGRDRTQIASTLSRAFLKMIFVDGLYHADPHPGNLVVLEDNVVGLLDYGQVGRLDRELKGKLTMLLSEYVQEDSAGFADVLLDMATTPPSLDRRAFKRDIDRILRQYYGMPVGEVHMGEMLERSFRVSARHGVRLPATVATLAKVVVELESIDSLLDPNYDLAADSRRFVERSIRAEFSTSELRARLLENMLAWKELLLGFPRRIGDIIENMAGNSFRIIFHHEGLEQATKDVDRAINRLSLALMSAAIIVSSALVLTAKVGPAWRGYPIVGIIGFGISFVFGVWLIISILRAGKLW